MKSKPIAMKTLSHKLCTAALLFALGATPLPAQTKESSESALTNAASANAASETAPVSPSAAESGQALPSHTKRKTSDLNESPVRIDESGIHVGGSSPVDINLPESWSHGQPVLPTHSSFNLHALTDIIAILSVFSTMLGVSALFFHFRHRRNLMLHETLRAMVDKGVAIPPELLVSPAPDVRRRTNGDLRNGLICMGVGLGLRLGLRSGMGGVGLIPFFIGAAFLATWLIEKRQQKKAGENP